MALSRRWVSFTCSARRRTGWPKCILFRIKHSTRIVRKEKEDKKKLRTYFRFLGRIVGRARLCFGLVVAAKALNLLLNKLKPKLMARVVRTSYALHWRILNIHISRAHDVLQIIAFALTCKPLRDWLTDRSGRMARPSRDTDLQFDFFLLINSYRCMRSGKARTKHNRWSDDIVFFVWNSRIFAPSDGFCIQMRQHQRAANGESSARTPNLLFATLD